MGRISILPIEQYKNQQKTVPNIQKLRYNIFEMEQKKKWKLEKLKY